MKAYLKMEITLFFMGVGHRNKKKIWRIENFQIKHFGNPNGPKYCPAHCGNGGKRFAALSLVALDIQAPKIELQCAVRSSYTMIYRVRIEFWRFHIYRR